MKRKTVENRIYKLLQESKRSLDSLQIARKLNLECAETIRGMWNLIDEDKIEFTSMRRLRIKKRR